MAKGNVPIVCAVVSVVSLRWRQSLAQTLLLRRTALPEITDETGLQLAELWSSDLCEQFYEAGRLLAFPRQRTKSAVVKVGFIDCQSYPLLQIPML